MTSAARPIVLMTYNIKNPDPDPMAQNDPQRGGGRRGNDGPPDLDELFRNLNNKLSRILGGKGGGDDNGVDQAGRQDARHDMFEHRLAGERFQHLARQAG